MPETVQTPLRRSGLVLATAVLATAMVLLPQLGFTAGHSELQRSAGAVPLSVAHRGLSGTAPENTMPAFRQAAAQGADYVELDIRLSSDGVPVVMHDAELDRTTDGKGKLGSFTAEQLRTLDAGSWFAAEYAGTRIPTLDEVLGFASTKKIRLVIEFKGHWELREVDTVATMLHEHGMVERVVLASFSADTLAAARLLLPEVPRMLLSVRLTAELPQRAQSLGASAVGVSMDDALRNRRRVAELRSSGMAVYSYTANRRHQWRALEAAGVDGIISDQAHLLHDWLAQYAPTG